MRTVSKPVVLLLTSCAFAFLALEVQATELSVPKPASANTTSVPPKPAAVAPPATTPAPIATAAAPTPGVQYPYKTHMEQNIDTHQVGWIDMTIDAQGHGSLTDSWSNGKQIAGNTFYAIVVLASKDGKVLWSNKQTKGIDGSWGGHAREGHAQADFTLDQDQMAAFDHVSLKMGVTNCGMTLSGFKCCDNGIEVDFSSQKCNVPGTPRPTPPHFNQAR